MYGQDIEAGYTAPGLTTLTDTQTYGGALRMPVSDRLVFGAKLDNLVQEQGLASEAQEYNLAYRLSYHWDMSAGYRVESRADNSPVVPLTQVEGERVDAILQLGCDSKSAWNTYGFVEDTMSPTISHLRCRSVASTPTGSAKSAWTAKTRNSSATMPTCTWCEAISGSARTGSCLLRAAC